MRSARNPGRFAGLLYVVTSVVGFFAMGYVPSKLIVHGNAAATANNITAHETLFRLGIAGELIGQAGFIFCSAGSLRSAQKSQPAARRADGDLDSGFGPDRAVADFIRARRWTSAPMS